MDHLQVLLLLTAKQISRYDAQETSCISNIPTQQEHIFFALLLWDIDGFWQKRIGREGMEEKKKRLLKAFFGFPFQFFKPVRSQKQFFQNFILQITSKYVFFALGQRGTALTCSRQTLSQIAMVKQSLSHSPFNSLVLERNIALRLSQSTF